MLADLHLKNLAVLAGAAVEFGPGLNVLTGETGAGKSIVVDSLALLAGGRASAELVRAGAESLAVAGLFRVGEELVASLAESGVAGEAGEVVVRREIGREGRNRVFVNDQPATVRLLAELAPRLLRIHGQREELGLTTPDLQRAWLDAAGGAAAEPLLAACRSACARHAELAARLARLRGDARLRQERLDLLRFLLAEIDQVQPRAGEEDELRRDREALRHREAIAASLGAAVELLQDGEAAASDRLGQARQRLETVVAWEPAAADAVRELAELSGRLGEAVRALAHRLFEVEGHVGRLDEVEQRLAALERLLRKHGGSSAAVLAARQAMAAELAEIEHDSGHADELEAQVDASLAAFRAAALDISAARERWGRSLAERWSAEIADLALPRARCAVRLERRARADSPLVLDGRAVDFGPEGIDQVVFDFAPNPGEPPRPLAKIASGGELSRLYLALQLAVRGERGEGPTLVFDEVDAGVGGAEAAALGRKLQRLATGGQVLAVTHLPQVASCADRHFRVAKRVEKERTFAEVELLDDDGRVAEIARMLAGERVTATTRSHAAELLAQSRRRRR